MPKNIVICCDSFFSSTHTSNVLKLYSILQHDPRRQITFYHPGPLGLSSKDAVTGLAAAWKTVLTLSFGYGYTQCLVECYSFLMENYEPGDHFFIFGFGTGAYTARSLTALLYMCGLLQKGNGTLIPLAIKLFGHPNAASFSKAGEFKSRFSRECKAHFVGVWDTASTVGWFYNGWKFPYTSNNPNTVFGRHAVSIDERRHLFSPNLWGHAMPDQDLKQVWFAGVHSDVGGSYVEAESGLSKIALEWMIVESVDAGLLINEPLARRILGREGEGYVAPNPNARMHNSLTGVWWILELLPGVVYDTSCIPPRPAWRIPLGSRRRIPEGSLIHETVFQRTKGVAHYSPSNIPRTCSIERSIGSALSSNPERFVNTWLDIDQNRIEPGVWYSFNVNIGPRRIPTRLSSSPPPDPNDAQPLVEVMVTLFSQDFDIEPRGGRLSLAPEGSTDAFCTKVKPRHIGPCRIEIVVSSVKELDILQRATAEIVVGDTEPATLYARN